MHCSYKNYFTLTKIAHFEIFHILQAIHSNVKKNHVDGRMKKLTTTNSIDWALAEAFAFGTLLHQGFDVRLSGQDVGRGTFSHRHLAITCQDSENIHYPLNHLHEKHVGQIEVTYRIKLLYLFDFSN